MKREEVTQNEVSCSTCGKMVPSYDTVNYGSVEKGYRCLCNRCFNQEVAQFDGLDKFEHVNFAPVVLSDCEGASHEFHFRTRLLGTEVALDAFELLNGQPAGYKFQMIGDAEEDPFALMGRLIERIRRALSTRYLRDSHLGLQIANLVVRGRIEWDSAHDRRRPLMIIDGQEVTWEEFGRMLMSFEGFQFQLNIRDKSEEF